MYQFNAQCNKTEAINRLFAQLFDLPRYKVALMEFGCTFITEKSAEISNQFNIIHVSICLYIANYNICACGIVR